MQDNVGELLALQSEILVSEMDEKTKECAISWEHFDKGSFHTTWVWDERTYDVYLMRLQSAILLDFIREDVLELSLTSSLEPKVSTLYETVTEFDEPDFLKEALIDLGVAAPGCDGGEELGLQFLPEANFASYDFVKPASGSFMANSTDRSIELFYYPEGNIVTVRKVGNINGIAVSTMYQKLFWTEMKDNAGPRSALVTADFDGGEDKVIAEGVCPQGVAVDQVHRRVFWTDSQSKEIRSCDFDGRNSVVLAVSEQRPYQIALDVPNRKFYWAARDTIKDGGIYRADLDGANVAVIRNTGLNNCRAVVLAKGKIFSSENGELKRMDLDGTNLETLSFGFSLIEDLATDSRQTYLFIADTGLDYVYRHRVGSERIDALTTQRANRRGIAIYG